MPRPDPFDPLDFLALAHDPGEVVGEDRLRTAIGRAYYSLFLLARERTGAFPYQERGQRPHPGHQRR